jgi:hypothetical protein
MEPVEDSATRTGGRQAGGVGQAPELIEEAGGWRSPGEEAAGMPEGGGRHCAGTVSGRRQARWRGGGGPATWARVSAVCVVDKVPFDG